MSGDYLEQLGANAIDLLASTTGVMSAGGTQRNFAGQPNDIRLALASPAAERLLDPDAATSAPRLLRLAVAVHRTCEEICIAAWTTRDASRTDVPLAQFAGQGQFQHLLVGVLAGQLPAEPLEGFEASSATQPATPERLIELIELCEQVVETERAGALRLLGDEALFSVGLFAGRVSEHRLDADLFDRLDAVLPRAVRNLRPHLRTELRSLLDVYLMLGPIWYQMAAQNLLHTRMQRSLSQFAAEFSNARRVLVRAAQGPLAPWLDDMYSSLGDRQAIQDLPN